jgi:glycosyltransferase involved in cell wall biosynthesis
MRRFSLFKKLVVDGRWTGNHGIARYAAAVLESLRTHVDFGLYADGRPGHFDMLRTRKALKRADADVFYSPSFHPAVLLPAVKQVLTVHDLIHLDVPDESSTVRTLYFRRLIRPTILRAGLVFTVSDYSRRRLNERLRIPVEMIVNAGMGCDPHFFTAIAATEESRPYVLFVGNAKPHKRLSYMLEAANFLDKDLALVIVGHVPEEELARTSEKVRRRLRIYEGIDDTRLASLYRGASSVAMPSTVEGFGLPALESAATGSPLVYSAEAVEEVVGDTGVRVRADAPPEEFAAAVTRSIDLPPKLRIARQELARRYTWSAVAARIHSELTMRGLL